MQLVVKAICTGKMQCIHIYWQLNMYKNLTLLVEIYSEVWYFLKRHTAGHFTNCIFTQILIFSGIKVEELSANLRTAVKPIVTHPYLKEPVKARGRKGGKEERFHFERHLQENYELTWILEYDFKIWMHVNESLLYNRKFHCQNICQCGKWRKMHMHLLHCGAIEWWNIFM